MLGKPVILEPVDEWGITQYILEEDDDNVPLIEYQWGLNGMHYLLAVQAGGILLVFHHMNDFGDVARRRWSSSTEFCESERLEGTRPRER